MGKLTGWSFPVCVDELTGRIKTVSDEENVKQGVKTILCTEQGERINLEGFGTKIKSSLFESTGPVFFSDLYDSTYSAIYLWEKHVKDINLTIDSQEDDPTKIVINLQYGTNFSEELMTESTVISINDVNQNSGSLEEKMFDI